MKPIPFDSLWLTWWIPPAWAVWRFALLIRGVLMRTAYFIDGIFAWFERAGAWLAQKFRRGGSEMHADELRARLEHIQCGIDCILERLKGDVIDQSVIDEQAAKLKASNEALAAAVSANSLPSNAAS